MKVDPLDLKTSFPRSPKERLGAHVHLARMIDKARASASGTLGEYIYPCPLDDSLLEFLGLNGGDLLKAIQNRDDQEMLEWIKGNAKARTPEEVKAWNQQFLNRKPSSDESWKRFYTIRNQLAPDRTDITTWPDLLDLEEGR